MNENNGWNDKQILLLKNWIIVCKKYKTQHDYERRIYKKKIRLLLWLSIIINSIVTALGAIAVGVIQKNMPLLILSTVLSTINTMLNVYKKNDNPEENMMKHSELMKGYSEIIYKIEKELPKDIKDKINCAVFTEEIAEQMLSLGNDSNELGINIEDDCEDIISSPPIIVSGLSEENSKKFELFFNPRGSMNELDRKQKSIKNFDLGRSFIEIYQKERYDEHNNEAENKV